MADVWSSEDAISWSESSSNCWPDRAAFAAVVYKDRMWIMGGVKMGGTNRIVYNDVWSSEDGVNWTQETASAPWKKRRGLACVVYKNKLWMTGGYDGNNEAYNDVWHSLDGKNWTKETSAGWAPRHTHASFVYDGKIWVMGGYNASDACYNDVWSYMGETAINNVLDKPEEVTLFQSPVHGNVNLSFYTSTAKRVTIGIYTITGQLVRHLVNKKTVIGNFNVCWSGTDDAGMNLSNGMYICKIEIAKKVLSKRIIFAK